MNIMAASLAGVVICQKSKKHYSCQEKLYIRFLIRQTFKSQLTIDYLKLSVLENAQRYYLYE